MNGSQMKRRRRDYYRDPEMKHLVVTEFTIESILKSSIIELLESRGVLNMVLGSQNDLSIIFKIIALAFSV